MTALTTCHSLAKSPESLVEELKAAQAWIDENGLPGKWTPTGWVPPEKPVPFPVWWATGMRLGELLASIHWQIGDWLNYGERTYRETYAQALETTGFSTNILYRDTWVCGAIPREIRQPPEKVSFSTHAIVAPVRFDLEEKRDWLAVAAEKGWSGARLKDEIKRRDRLPAGECDTVQDFIRAYKVGDGDDNGSEPAVADDQAGQDEVGDGRAVGVMFGAAGRTEAYCPHCGALFELVREGVNGKDN